MTSDVFGWDVVEDDDTIVHTDISYDLLELRVLSPTSHSADRSQFVHV